jgi:hypothetical protein
VHEKTGEVLYLEVMGYWSRDAVWRRVELVEQGLSERILFAVSSRLRVSEAVLDDAALAALYVYKTTLNPRAVLERLEELRRRTVKTRPAHAPAASKRKPSRAALPPRPNKR